MKIGMIIAIQRELESFLKLGGDISEETVAGRTVYRTRIGTHDICALQPGYGEIDAAAGTMLLILQYGCEVIINFGVVGALEEDLKVQDLFLVEKVRHYDYDVSPIDPVEPHQYEEYPGPFIPMDQGLIRKVKEMMPEIRCVAAASGDRFVEEREEKIRLRQLGCAICDMESAAIARISERSGVRCLSVKCISDTFDGDGGDFNRNVRASGEKAFRVIREVLEAL